MRLKDRTESVWETIDLPHYSEISEHHSTDICIIGGGLTGVSVAYQMAKRGYKVTLVEAFRIASGQTGRTTAHLTCQLEEDFQELLKLHDKETVRTFLEAHRTAIDVVENITEIENISCDFKRVDGFYFEGKNYDREKLLKEQEAAKKCGIDLDLMEVTPLLERARQSLRYPRQAQFNPLKYIKGLLRVLKELDVNVYEGTHVSSIHQEKDDSWRLETVQGYDISAKYIVVATDSPINNRYYIHTKQAAYRTYSMAFKLTGPVKEECLLWDSEDPYHYIRFVEDTLVVGGEDHRTGQEPESDPFLSLEEWTRKNFNFVKEVLWRWSGQVFEPMDQIAFIGRNPGVEKNVFICTGLSGIGMTSGTIASLIIPDLIEKGDHPWAKVFDPARPPVRGVRDFVEENLNVALQYKDWITPSEVDDVSEIGIDQGSVMREGISKTCIYHDDNDHFEKKSAVCTHLGGIVHWNDIEKTWDCPCHGSRFNTKGQVIEGPAINGLSEK